MTTKTNLGGGISRLDYAGTHSFIGNGWRAVKLAFSNLWSVSPESGSAPGVGIIVPEGELAEGRVLDFMRHSTVPPETMLRELRTRTRGNVPIPFRRIG